MKYLIASDIHGAFPAAQAVIDFAEKEQVDGIMLLGDILYHGPRNDLPQGYAPKDVMALLNNHASEIMAVQGNCDAEVDQMVLDFPLMNKTLQVEDAQTGITLFLTHGHRQGLNPQEKDQLVDLPKKCLFCSGHTHVKVLARDTHCNSDGTTADVLYLNPGSTSIPKDGSASFALYDNGVVTLYTLDGKPLATENF